MKVLNLRWIPGMGWMPWQAPNRFDGCMFKDRKAARDYIKRRRLKVVPNFITITSLANRQALIERGFAEADFAEHGYFARHQARVGDHLIAMG